MTQNETVLCRKTNNVQIFLLMSTSLFFSQKNWRISIDFFNKTVHSICDGKINCRNGKNR